MMAGGAARVRRRLFLVGLAGLMLAGCGGTTKKPKGVAAEKEKLPTVDLDTALAVDEGRIAVASPSGWTRLPRTKDCLVKYQPGPKKTYPKILVTAEDAPAEFPEVTADNHQAFVAAVADGVEQSLGKAKPLRKAAAARLGPHFGVTWGIPGSAKADGIAEPIERWNWAVVIGGRMYTVEARAPKGKIDDAGKAAAKAVAAALAPPSAATQTDAAPAEAAETASPLDALMPPAAEPAKPADSKPADPAPAAAAEDADK